MKKRHDGIDTLRIVSMFMVVILHVLVQSGILYNTPPLSSHFCLSWFLEISAYCAVNCFALISGFVMYRSKPSISRLVQLWLQVVFYTVLITGIFALISPQTFSLRGLIKAFFPVSTRGYWYISSYFGLYLFTPLLNTALQNIGKKTFDMILFGLFSTFCVTTTFLLHDPFVLNGGYSTIWLLTLYLVGAYIHKYHIAAKLNKCVAFGLFLLMVLITFASKILFTRFGITLLENVLVSYVSPTIALSGLFLFIFFVKFEEIPPLQGIIRIMAPASLGVYLIHVHPLVWDHVLCVFSDLFTNYNCIIMVLLVFGASAVIYLVCTFIDLLRINLFQLLKVKSLCARLDNFIMRKLGAENELENP